MIRNFLKIAFRNIANQKLYSAINIIGLTVGITASILLLLYVKDELSFDKIHPRAEQLYRVNTLATIQDTELKTATVMAPLGPVLHQDYPEVLNYCRIDAMGEELVIKGETQFYEDGFIFADSSFFSLFGFELIKGNPATALAEPNSIVLSESLAKKYFGNEDPMGKEIKTGSEEWTREVKGVMKDSRAATHFKPSAIVSYATLPDDRVNFWGNLNDYLYIQLPEGYAPEKLEAKFPEVFDKYIAELFSQFDAHADFRLINVQDIHLQSDYENEINPSGSMDYIYIFSAIAIFILIIASINYMNLATARATSRAKEVGIRKVMGAYKRQLRWQFMTESIVVTGIAAIISVILIFFLLPSFNSLTGKTIAQTFYLEPVVIIGFMVLIAMIGAISGSYPALYLSSFKPASVLKGRLASGGNIALRKVLVIAQFAISLVMIVSTLIVYDQLQFLKDKDLGLNKDQVLRIPLNGSAAREKYEVLRTRLLQSPGIESVGSGWTSPGTESLNVQATTVESNTGELIDKVFQTLYIDQHYFETLEIEIAEGRGFNKDIGRDTADAVLVNEKMVDHMGWDNPIGKRFMVIANQNLDRREMKVVGVFKDFHLRALKAPIEPMVAHLSTENGQMLVRFKPESTDEVINTIRQSWAEVVPNRPLEYTFVEQDFFKQYEEDRRKGQVFALFSIITIIIACMGLFGLASYNAELKRKEIGIRKVIGASLLDIIYMVSKDFMILVSISMLIAFPIAYFFMDKWLEEFSYRIDISVLTFLLSIVITVAITLITIGYHSMTAAMSNPASSLKEE